MDVGIDVDGSSYYELVTKEQCHRGVLIRVVGFGKIRWLGRSYRQKLAGILTTPRPLTLVTYLKTLYVELSAPKRKGYSEISWATSSHKRIISSPTTIFLAHFAFWATDLGMR